MSEGGGLAALGVNPVLLLGQIVNFLLLFLILKKLIYGPLTKALASREQKEKEREELEKKIKKEWASLEEMAKEKKAEARREAQKFIKEAKSEAGKEKEAILVKAKKEAGEILERAKTEVKREKEKSKKEMEEGAVRLASKITEKLIDDLLGKKEQKSLISQATKSLRKIRV